MANIYALRNSSLNAFLFSDVGVEANGTSLTILSLLARLGKDPWAEAAAWARKPKDAAIRVLTDSISQMPPNQQAFDDAFLTASRLVDLLPAGINPTTQQMPRRAVRSQCRRRACWCSSTSRCSSPLPCGRHSARNPAPAAR